MNDNFDRTQHWQKVYDTKSLEEVSWYQPTPTTSLTLIEELNLPKNAKIIDIGGGDSFLVDHLLELGYTDVSVLDISEKSLERAQERLGEKAKNVTWIVADAANFVPAVSYDLWHDRAAFHFLTQASEIENYTKTVSQFLKTKAHLIIGTFSTTGPKKCSGIEIQQYSEASLIKNFEANFTSLKTFFEDHPTPFDTVQNFVFGVFQKH